MTTTFPEQTPEERYNSLSAVCMHLKENNAKLEKQNAELKKRLGIDESEGIWQWEAAPINPAPPVEGLVMWINENPIPLKDIGPLSANVPREPFPTPTTAEFKELHGQINLAVRKMQFGDVLWMRVERGNQSEVAELIAALIYNNRNQWKKLLR